MRKIRVKGRKKEHKRNTERKVCKENSSVGNDETKKVPRGIEALLKVKAGGDYLRSPLAAL